MVIYELIGHGVTITVVIYVGLHLRRQLHTLKGTVEAQKATIDAQAEQMKAQSTVLENFERLNKQMKEVIDTVDAPAMLKRMQAYKEIVELERQQLTAQVRRETNENLQQVREDVGNLVGDFYVVISSMMRFIPPAQRLALIEASDLPTRFKQGLKKLADAAPYLPTGEKPSTPNTLPVDFINALMMLAERERV